MTSAPLVDPVRRIVALPPGTTPWPTPDPFLFCVHHFDQYPSGNGKFGPSVSTQGRPIGSDFAGIDGWNMYHGREVPGFPQHPHRGFETITVVRQGLLDHADSLGAAARYGHGDVQWMTAGQGISHSEMFPLLRTDGPNPTELFQIWLNLPKSSKMVEPHFTMLWAESIPDYRVPGVEIAIIAGELEGQRAPNPPPHSWAADRAHGVAIWTIKMEEGARFVLAPAKGTTRSLYFHTGRSVMLGQRQLDARHLAELGGDSPLELVMGPGGGELLLLQGQPIAEPIARHGPFVMNTREEIGRAYDDYRRTGFGGWPWPVSDPVHGEQPERFARHADGRTEAPA